MTTTETCRDLLAIGRLASEIGKPVRHIEAAARALDIEPSMILNRVAFFDAAQVERLTAHLRGPQGG